MTNATQPPLSTLSIPRAVGSVTINVEAGKPIFIVGRNGTGKSALVHSMINRLGQKVVYLPGSRPSHFDQESLTMSPAARANLINNLKSWDASPDVRWRVSYGSSKNEKAIHDLQTAETSYKVDAANEIKRDGAASTAITRLQSNTSPVDRVNALFAQANLPIRTVIEGGELKAARGGHVYSIAKTSDGERAALVLTAEVIAAPDNTVFLIDEPELHLHAAIVVPLLAALIAERPTCTFIISTHELALPGTSSSAKIILVRGCTWQNQSVNSWDVDVLEDSSQIPEDLRIDVLGSRRKVLFIEGSSTSLDQPLYELLFPAISIRPREGCREVSRAVTGLRAIETLHHASAFGLVDNDGMSASAIAELEAQEIYPLPIFSVESLYYCAEVLEAVAEQQSTTLGVPSADLLSQANAAAISALQISATAEHLASRVAEQKMRAALLLSLPDRQSMMAGNNAPISISITSPYAEELTRIQALLAAGNVEGVISQYPVRESGCLSGLARGLRFMNPQDYERAALTRIGADKSLQATLRLKLGKLAIRLDGTQASSATGIAAP